MPGYKEFFNRLSDYRSRIRFGDSEAGHLPGRADERDIRSLHNQERCHPI